MQCTQCNTTIAEGGKFCPNCGTAAPTPAPVIQSAGGFCPSCGAAQTVVAKFCPSCGSAIAIASVAIPAPTVQSAPTHYVAPPMPVTATSYPQASSSFVPQGPLATWVLPVGWITSVIAIFAYISYINSQTIGLLLFCWSLNILISICASKLAVSKGRSSGWGGLSFFTVPLVVWIILNSLAPKAPAPTLN
jgi:RNA polymerase subunit RPABC4/transcription elongation factor Spt4